MKNIRFNFCASVVALVLSAALLTPAQVKKTVTKPAPKPPVEKPAKPAVAERNVRAQLEFLASDAMQGRGSGSQFERITAEYIGSQLMQFGVLPAGQKDASGRDTYIQTAEVAGRPAMQSVTITGAALKLGQNVAFFGIGAKTFGGELQKIKPGDAAKSGSVVFLQVPKRLSSTICRPSSRLFFRPAR